MYRSMSQILVSLLVALMEPGLADPGVIATKKTIQAITVDKCATCQGNDILLTSNGLSQLSPGTVEHDWTESKKLTKITCLDSSPNHAPGTVSWTFQ